MAPNVTTANLVSAIAGQAHLPVSQLFRKGEMVGKGAYGAVHRGTHIATGAVVALKIINLDTADDDVEAIQKEVALLSQLRGGEATNVTQYYGCWLEGPRVWIAMDFASGGSVRTLMKASESGTLEERYVVVITREVLVALSFLHRAGIIHRDIKAANVLVTAQGRVVLCDFGVSALLATTHSKRATFVGTPYWMAPEVISGSLYDTKADIWGLGITVYEMMMRTPPHSDQVPMRALVLITAGKPPRLPDNVGSREMKDFLASCLRESPVDRLTADELSRSKWIKAITKAPVSMLKDLLVKYDGWLHQGGVRESIAGDVPWEEEAHRDDRDILNWEFDTIRGRSDSDTGIFSLSNAYVPGIDPISPEISFTTSTTPISTNPKAPRSLRMLFEDSSDPPPLPDTFLRNNVGSSRERFHGAHSQSPAAVLSAPSQTSLLSPKPLSEPPQSDECDSTKDAIENLHTAKQTNFVFPPPTPKPGEYNEHASTFDLDLNPPADYGTPPSPPSLLRTSTDQEPIGGIAGVYRPPPATSAPIASSWTSSEIQPVDTVKIPPSMLEPLSRSAEQSSEQKPQEGSPKPAEKRNMRKRVAPMTFQFPPPSNAKGSNANVNTGPSSTGSPTPSNDPSAALSPPNPLIGHHPTSRSLDGQPQGGVEISASSRAPGNISPQLSGGWNLTTMPTVRLTGHAGASSNGRDFDNVNEGNGRLLPIRPGLKKQVSMETIGSNGAPFAKGVTLKDVLQLSALSSEHSNVLGTIDLLPPSPSTHSPLARVFPNGITPGSHSEAYTSSSGSHLGPAGIGESHTALAGIPHLSSQTSSTSLSTSSTSTSISSSNTSLILPQGPFIQPLDYGGLLAVDDVHGELVRCVDDLASWLGVVESGLGGFLDAISHQEAGQKVLRETDGRAGEESEAGDDDLDGNTLHLDTTIHTNTTTIR